MVAVEEEDVEVVELRGASFLAQYMVLVIVECILCKGLFFFYSGVYGSNYSSGGVGSKARRMIPGSSSFMFTYRDYKQLSEMLDINASLMQISVSKHAVSSPFKPHPTYQSSKGFGASVVR